MPRVPKSPPAWLKEFCNFAHKQDKKQFTASDKKKFLSIFDKYWGPFHVKATTEAAQSGAAKGAKKTGARTGAKKQDPMAALENAIKKMNEKMVTEGSVEERQRMQDGLAAAVQDLVPGLKSVIAPSEARVVSAPQTNDVPDKDPAHRAALMSEATELYTHVTTEIDLSVPAESASVVKKDVEKLYDITLRAIS